MLARRVHREFMEPEHGRPTRAASRGVWAGLVRRAGGGLAGAIPGSAVLRLWSVWANLVTPVASVGFFVGEHVMRYRWHPEFERVSTGRGAGRLARQGGLMTAPSPLPLLAPRELDAPHGLARGACAQRAPVPRRGAGRWPQALPAGRAGDQSLPRSARFCRRPWRPSLVRGAPSLLPPNALPATLAALTVRARRVQPAGRGLGTGGPGLQARGLGRCHRGGARPGRRWTAPRCPPGPSARRSSPRWCCSPPAPPARRWPTARSWWAVVENARAQALRLSEALGRSRLAAWKA